MGREYRLPGGHMLELLLEVAHSCGDQDCRSPIRVLDYRHLNCHGAVVPALKNAVSSFFRV